MSWGCTNDQSAGHRIKRLYWQNKNERLLQGDDVPTVGEGGRIHHTHRGQMTTTLKSIDLEQFQRYYNFLNKENISIIVLKQF